MGTSHATASFGPVPRALAAVAAAAVLLGPAWCRAAGAPAVAIVTEARGDVRISAHGRTHLAEASDAVEEGATLALERDARAVLAYPVAGAVYELNGPGRFVARAASVQWRSGPGRVSRRELAPQLRALRIRPEGATLQGSAAMRGAGSLQLQAQGPTGTRGAGDPLRLCWRPQGARWVYRVRLIDEDGMLVFEAQTSDSAFDLPATLPLRAGTPYLWHLTALGPDARRDEAAGEFRRLEAGAEGTLLAAEAVVEPTDATGRELVRIARRQQGFAEDAGARCARAGAD